jgi:hypothetical protein
MFQKFQEIEETANAKQINSQFWLKLGPIFVKSSFNKATLKMSKGRDSIISTKTLNNYFNAFFKTLVCFWQKFINLYSSTLNINKQKSKYNNDSPLNAKKIASSISSKKYTIFYSSMSISFIFIFSEINKSLLVSI